MPPKRSLPSAIQTLCDNVSRHCSISYLKNELDIFLVYNYDKKDVGTLLLRVCRSLFVQPGNIKDKAAAAVDIQHLINHFDPSVTFDTSPHPSEVTPDSVETVVAKLDATVTSQGSVLAGLLTTLTALSAAIAASSAGSTGSSSVSAGSTTVSTGSSSVSAGSTTVSTGSSSVSTSSSAVGGPVATGPSTVGPVSTGPSTVGPVSTGPSTVGPVSTGSSTAGTVSTSTAATVSGKKRGAPRGPRSALSKRAATGSGSAGPAPSSSASAGPAPSSSASSGPAASSFAPPARSRSASPTARTRSPSPVPSKARTVRFDPTMPIASATPQSDAMYWKNVNPVDEESSLRSVYNLRKIYWKLKSPLIEWEASNPALELCETFYTDFERLSRWVADTYADDLAGNKKKNNICVAHILARYGNALNELTDDERSAVPVPWMLQSAENMETIGAFNPDTHVFA